MHRILEMAELESTIENNLINQLCLGDSQWEYREDLKTEYDLWNNFKQILEQNNKAKLHSMKLANGSWGKAVLSRFMSNAATTFYI